jgi:hypothetical protein
MLAFLMPALWLSFDFYIEFAEVEYKMVPIGRVLTLLQGRLGGVAAVHRTVGPLVFVDEMASNVF